MRVVSECDNYLEKHLPLKNTNTSRHTIIWSASNMPSLDIDANRSSIKYSKFELMRRLMWMFCSPLFKYSFRTMFGWRSFLLRSFGARIGQGVHIYSSAVIYMPWNLEIGDYSSIGEHCYIYNLGLISIGDRSTISHKAHLCAGTHDYLDARMPLIKQGITIGDEVWICADSFVGPNVSIPDGVVLGACSVVTKNLSPWSVYAGNPARLIKQRVMKH